MIPHIVFRIPLLDGLNSIQRNHATWCKSFSGITTDDTDDVDMRRNYRRIQNSEPQVVQICTIY